MWLLASFGGTITFKSTDLLSCRGPCRRWRPCPLRRWRPSWSAWTAWPSWQPALQPPPGPPASVFLTSSVLRHCLRVWSTHTLSSLLWTSRILSALMWQFSPVSVSERINRIPMAALLARRLMLSRLSLTKVRLYVDQTICLWSLRLNSLASVSQRAAGLSRICHAASESARASAVPLTMDKGTYAWPLHLDMAVADWVSFCRLELSTTWSVAYPSVHAGSGVSLRTLCL